MLVHALARKKLRLFARGSPFSMSWHQEHDIQTWSVVFLVKKSGVLKSCLPSDYCSLTEDESRDVCTSSVLLVCTIMFLRLLNGVGCLRR